MKRQFKIAVRELVGYVLRAGDLELEFLGPGRSVEGIRAHQRVQKSRPDNYVSELSVSYQVETEQFLLEISGRIDGIYYDVDSQKPGMVIIDEIKSTTRDLDRLEKEENQVHWAQVKCYAYIYAADKGLDEIGTQLTYYHLESREIRELRREFTIDELEKDFQDFVKRYLEWANEVAKWGHIRDESIRKLDFPFLSYRSGQRRMAVDVYRTIKSNGQLIVQAATGIGKTMAAIFPAIKAIAEGLNGKIFYLTARTTGRKVAEKALDELRSKGLKIKSLTLTAKDKICFNPDSLCTAEECEFAKGHYDRIGEAMKSLFQEDAHTREVIERTAMKFKVCPFEFSLDLALWVDGIICDYNYAFDPKVYLRRFFLEANGDYTFLIDEAHNLVSRSREMFSAEIQKQPFLDVRRKIKKELPRIYKSIGKINSRLVRAIKKCEEKGEALTEKELPSDLLPLLRDFTSLTEQWLSLNLRTSFREELLELYFTVTGFLRIADQYDESYVTCFEKNKKDLRLKLFCMDPSGQLKEALKRCKSAIFYSATMTPANYFQKILGCEESASRLILPSPFPPDNLGLFIADRISTLYRQRENTKLKVADTILTMIEHKKGNYLLYFPSYAYMTLVYTSVCEKNRELEKIIQVPGMSEPERDAFLERFSQDNPDTLVGFAVMGGIFGEGIDLVGDRLAGVVIVGVGLPGISMESELIRDHFAGLNDAGFEYAYLFPGINRVLQAAGRVIRTDSDRGVVLLIDQRFSTSRYKSLFPIEWRPLRVGNEEQLEEGMKRFWSE